MAPEEVLRALARQGLDGAEVFLKHGRSRRLELTVGGEAAVWSEERAWAVRAGNRRGSFFAAGTGEPPPEGPWPPPLGPLLVLPEASAGAPWSEPGDFDAPLIGESEGFGLLRTIGRELAVELPGARLLHAALEDGWSEGDLASSRGVRARRRQRVASLHVEASGPARPARIGNAPAAASLYLAAREARRFQAKALARHLADRLSVNASTTFPDELADRPLEVLLAPPAAARLLAGLLPLLVGPRAASRGAALRDPRGRLASDLLTVIDDGRLAGGVFESPLDGEGVPSREVVLVEDGIFRQPLLAWWQADGAGAAAGETSGCSRRASWRDLPSPGPTHLYVQPDPRISVASLLGAVGRGAYLIDATGGALVDLEGDRFALPVCGFTVRAGRAGAPIASAWLRGGVGDLLRGIAGVGRDLTFHPLDGMIGSPTLLVTGLTLARD